MCMCENIGNPGMDLAVNAIEGIFSGPEAGLRVVRICMYRVAFFVVCLNDIVLDTKKNGKANKQTKTSKQKPKMKKWEGN